MSSGLRIFLLVAGCACLVPAAGAQSRSPFLPPSDSPVQAATENAPLQFCGYVGSGDSARYCVFDPAKRRSVWLRVGDEATGVRVEGFDTENRTLSVVQGGRTLVLRLQSPTPGANPGAGPAPGGPLPIAGQTQPNNTLVNTVVANPTPADEAKRLEAVAAEVRRRRALRQAAAQQQQQQQQQPNGGAR